MTRLTFCGSPSWPGEISSRTVTVSDEDIGESVGVELGAQAMRASEIPIKRKALSVTLAE